MVIAGDIRGAEQLQVLVDGLKDCLSGIGHIVVQCALGPVIESRVAKMIIDR